MHRQECSRSGGSSLRVGCISVNQHLGNRPVEKHNDLASEKRGIVESVGSEALTKPCLERGLVIGGDLKRRMVKLGGEFRDSTCKRATFPGGGLYLLCRHGEQSLRLLDCTTLNTCHGPLEAGQNRGISSFEVSCN